MKTKLIKVALLLVLFGCGIKGPPLPPLEYSEGQQLNSGAATTGEKEIQKTPQNEKAGSAKSTDKTKAKK